VRAMRVAILLHATIVHETLDLTRGNYRL
jgi:hypothetical protein